MAQTRRQRFNGMRRMEGPKGIQNEFSADRPTMKRRTKKPTHFAVCINSDRYKALLEIGKLYRIVPDEKAESRGYLRVVDESGKHCGYSTSRFFRLEISKPLEKALARAS
jgi:hypothetical protein